VHARFGYAELRFSAASWRFCGGPFGALQKHQDFGRNDKGWDLPYSSAIALPKKYAFLRIALQYPTSDLC
jgi:hypothetical protein